MFLLIANVASAQEKIKYGSNNGKYVSIFNMRKEWAALLIFTKDPNLLTILHPIFLHIDLAPGIAK
jgi:hypothetical protein